MEIRGKSSTFKWWNPDKVYMTYNGHLNFLKIIKNFKTGYKKIVLNQNSFGLSIILKKLKTLI